MKRLFPVIHIENAEQALRNARLAVELELDGVFLIHHKKKFPHLLGVADQVRKEFPDLWIGINALDLTTNAAFCIVPEWVNALWADDSGVYQDYTRGPINDSVASQFDDAREQMGWAGEYFGGFAFKYQAPIFNLREGAEIASKWMDTITTSGDGTGIAADVDKIRQIYEGKRNARLGIASGITPANVNLYLPYVDDFLVATGISKDEYNLDKELTTRLRDQIYENSQRG